MGRRAADRGATLVVALDRWLDRLPLLAALAATAGAESPVIVGCSGGADSLALLALAAGANVPVVAVYVDHGLRAGSECDFAVVVEAARVLGVPARTVRVELDPGPNLEARARNARYAALDSVRDGVNASCVLIAHTADDQAETVLLNLLRGSASAGLAAMRERQGTIVRPLLALRRSDTLEICARLGFAPVVDPMNSDPRYRRVWLRREVIPALEAGAERDLRGLLARQATVLRDESDLLDALAREALTAAGDPLRAAAVAALDPAIARRTVRRWLGGSPPSLAAVDAVLAVAAGARRSVELPGGRRVVRRRGLLVQEPASGGGPESAPAAPAAFALPGSASGVGISLETWIERAAPVAWPDGRDTCVVDADAVGDHAWLRRADPGERFAPLGMTGTKAVGGVSEDCRVVARGASDGVVWVVGYRIDDRVRITSRTRRFLWMTVSDPVLTA